MSSLNGGPMPPHVGFASPIGSSTENLDPKTDRRHNTIKRQPQNQRPLPADYNKYMRELMEMIGDKDLVRRRAPSVIFKPSVQSCGPNMGTAGVFTALKICLKFQIFSATHLIYFWFIYK